MNNFYTNVITPDTAKTFSHYNITPDPSFTNSIASVGFADEFYNTDKGGSYIAAFGQNSATDFKNGDIGGVAFETAFLTNSSDTAGLETRRLAEAFFQLGGIVEIGQSETDGALTVSSAEFNRAQATTLISFAQYVAVNTNLVTGGLYSDDNVTAYNLGFDGLNAELLTQGYYVPQPVGISWDSDTGTAITTPLTISWDNIATLVNNSGVLYNGLVFTGTTLQHINAVFADSSLKAGGMVHVPLAAQQAGFPLTIVPASQTYVFDATSNAVYTVGESLDAHDAGGLLIDTPGLAVSGFPLFAQGTYSNVYYDTGTKTYDVTLEDINGDSVGTLALSTSGSDYFTLTDGTLVPFARPSGSIHLTAPTSATETTEQTILGYLSQLGDAATAATLSNLNYLSLNPTGKAYNVTGVVTFIGPPPQNVQGVQQLHAAAMTADSPTQTALVAYQPGGPGMPGGPGAVMNGQTTIVYNGITYNAYNYLDVADAGTTDFSQDTFSGMQALTLGTGAAAATAELTSAQFGSLSDITGSGTLVITTAGNVSLNAVDTQPDHGTFNLTAQGWGGTTLNGDATNGQVLTASLYGNDTLNAGSGFFDGLVAGQGVDTISAPGFDTILAGDNAINAANDNAATLLRPAANDDCAPQITLLKVV